jgi:hypothetical protein
MANLISQNILVNSRADLRPNPAVDSISAICYCIRDDNAIDRAGISYRDFLGILIVGNDSSPFIEKKNAVHLGPSRYASLKEN